jgi:hypothetical protein
MAGAVPVQRRLVGDVLFREATEKLGRCSVATYQQGNEFYTFSLSWPFSMSMRRTATNRFDEEAKLNRGGIIHSFVVPRPFDRLWAGCRFGLFQKEELIVCVLCFLATRLLASPLSWH